MRLIGFGFRNQTLFPVRLDNLCRSILGSIFLPIRGYSLTIRTGNLFPETLGQMWKCTLRLEV
jgi:hypothetical protein